MWKKLLLAALVVWGAYSWWSARPVSRGPGVIATATAKQTDAAGLRPFDLKGYHITPLAQFEIEARVLSREDYHLGREADLSPLDLALGWGRMSDEAVLEKINISQSNRFYYWHVEEFPIPRREIETSSANMHLIPADRTVAHALKRVRKGQLVHLVGYLVRADADDGWHWISSLTREDTGAGSCELVYVESASAI